MLEWGGRSMIWPRRAASLKNPGREMEIWSQKSMIFTQ